MTDLTGLIDFIEPADVIDLTDLIDLMGIVGPHLAEGMTVLDVGCGMRFFTLPMAQMVGTTGRVITVDIQANMLSALR